jgi:hypothetical protein
MSVRERQIPRRRRRSVRQLRLARGRTERHGVAIRVEREDANRFSEKVQLAGPMRYVHLKR